MRLNSTHYLIMRINNRKELQNIGINHSADIDFNDFMRIYRECTRKPYSFLTIDTLPASDPLRFRKNKKDKKELPKKPTQDDLRKFNEWINEKGTGINRELFKKHFNFQRLSAMLTTVFDTNDKKKNSNLENLIKSGLSDFKNEIENMNEEEK